ncbi:MAG: hypothetical protein WA802_10440 [Terracidiphilus sp.]
MYLECRHVLHNGAKCHSPALRGTNYCYFHSRLHRHATPSRTSSASAPAEPEPLKIPILEDRSAILIALSQIVDALFSSKIDPRSAGLSLYALQIASQNVERKQDVLPFKAVQSITHTADGDELAPELCICEDSDKCSACDLRDTCRDFAPDEDEEAEP